MLEESFFHLTTKNPVVSIALPNKRTKTKVFATSTTEKKCTFNVQGITT